MPYGMNESKVHGTLEKVNVVNRSEGQLAQSYAVESRASNDSVTSGSNAALSADTRGCCIDSNQFGPVDAYKKVYEPPQAFNE